MADSFFSQFFEQAQGQAVPAATPQSPPSQSPLSARGAKGASGDKEVRENTPKAFIAGQEAARVNEKLTTLEMELAREKERALTLELRMKEMENARSAVEEMFEKLWAKASKEKLEEEMRMVRERSLGRTEVLEKRLDEFQGAFLQLLKDWSGKQQPQQASQPPPQAFYEVQNQWRQLQRDIRLKLGAIEEIVETWKSLMTKVSQSSQTKPKTENPSELQDSIDRIANLFNGVLKNKEKGQHGI